MEHPAYSQLRRVSPSASVVLCPNPSYATLEGTNSWVIAAPDDEVSIVVDPGPEDEGHLTVLNTYAREVGVVLITHRHEDHAGGAGRFRQLNGAPVRAASATRCVGAEPIADGEVISVEGVTPQLEAVHTPGHTADGVSFFVWSGAPHESELEGIITGDTIAGRHTTMISESDGDLAKYLDSLETLKERGRGVRLLPGHGPDRPDTGELAEKYIKRRLYRLDQIREVRREHGSDIGLQRLIDLIYDDVDPVLRYAAEQSTRVALRYLDAEEAKAAAGGGES
ncbi:MBL fold metallo-hydrolase [Corynebacterium otitidis]|uniref:MBL fold metallo-hydrolase n=1 Tax=Corynebacterium otitidis TaxID=29321 RepID=UPI00062795B3|nr:MBL fold metallo-hydrolase [Corynebacterium otitidis]KKO83182.1 beta-lactamase [Corynebacterium otitidis]